MLYGRGDSPSEWRWYTLPCYNSTATTHASTHVLQPQVKGLNADGAADGHSHSSRLMDTMGFLTMVCSS